MASPPPPYDDITGISRTVMKDNAQVTLENYNGNARPGELVANLTTDPPALYIGNNAGQLTSVFSSAAQSYGSWYSDVTQTITANTVANISVNNSFYEQGVTAAGNVWTVANTGTYNIQVSYQFTKTDGGTDFAESWLAKNGNNVANTNTRIRLTGANDYVIFALNYVENFVAGDTFQLRWYSLDPNIRLLAIAAPTNPARPAIPSAIVTCVPVGA
jgi:hypothetical protein